MQAWVVPGGIRRRARGAVAAKERTMNKPFTSAAAVVLALISLIQLWRLLAGWEVTVNALAIPLWLSGVAFVVLAALGAGVWRERRP